MSVIAAVLFFYCATDGRDTMFLIWYAIERIAWLVTYLFMVVTEGLVSLHERLMLMRVISFMKWNKKEDPSSPKGFAEANRRQKRE